MNWTYALERMPSPDNDNSHVVRVTSKPRQSGGGGDIEIRFFTNVDSHAIKVKENMIPRYDYARLMGLQSLNNNKGSLTATAT